MLNSNQTATQVLGSRCSTLWGFKHGMTVDTKKEDSPLNLSTNAIVSPGSEYTIDSAKLFSSSSLEGKRSDSMSYSTNCASEEVGMKSAPVKSHREQLLSYFEQNYCLCVSDNSQAKEDFVDIKVPSPRSAPASKSAFKPLGNKKNVVIKPVALKPAPIFLNKRKKEISEPKSEISVGESAPENMEQKVEDLIKLTFTENIHKSGEPKVSKRRQFHLRQDVITKTIFRSMRKYYVKEFKPYFDFTKQTSQAVLDDEGLLTKAQTFIKASIGEPVSDKASLYLLSLLDTKAKFATEKSENIRVKMSALLYNFNKSKMEEMMKAKEFCALLLHFISQESIISKIVKRTDAATVKAYESQITNLQGQCRLTLLN